ncbi:MAG: DUF488 domain-containing protein [Anaerolineae bacterium]
MEPVTIYTIGHSNVPASDIVALIKRHGITMLVDVRSSPYSQYCPQYNRETLIQTLRQAGIEYRYLGDSLGGRPKDPTCYKLGQLPDKGDDYIHLVDYPVVMTKDFFRTGIQQLLAIAEQACTSVLCSEEDPNRCHRHHLIGRYLVSKGVSFLHIRGDGVVVPDRQLKDLVVEPEAQQLTLF